MPSASMNRLVENATFRLPGALPGAMLPELYAVLDDFFQVTKCWHENIPFIATPAAATYLADPDAYTYELIPTMGKIVRLVWASELDGAVVAASMPVPGDLVLAHSPAVTTSCIARTTITVADPVTRDGYPECPDWVISKYNSGLLDGLLGRMMSQIAKPYSNAQMAMMHLKKFRSTMSSAHVQTLRQNVQGAQSWRFPQTFNRAR